jgi:hypothetical protein
MFVISEAEAAAIRATYKQRGEFSAAIELRQLFQSLGQRPLARDRAHALPRLRIVRNASTPRQTPGR